MVLASMGNYIFNRHPLEDMLHDSQDGQSVMILKDVIPKMYPGGKFMSTISVKTIYAMPNRRGRLLERCWNHQELLGSEYGFGWY